MSSEKGLRRFKTLPYDLRPIFRPIAPTRPIQEDYRVVGWDSETDRRGNTYLIVCTSRKESVLLSPRGQSLKTEEMLRFLWTKGQHNHGKPVVNLWWNLSFDFDGIMKGSGVTREENRRGKAKIGGFSIRWIKGKTFSIRKGEKSAVFYDANNFFKMKLDYAAKKYLGRGKGKFLEMDVASGREKYSDEELVARCKTDALLTKELGEYLVRTIEGLIGWAPKKYFGGARLAEEVLRLEVSESILHPYADTPETRSILDYAYKSYYGGRFDLYYKGRVEGAFEMDYSSAYPYEIQNLVALNTGTWSRVEEPSDDPVYGFYNVVTEFDGLLPYRLFSVFYPVLTQPRETYVCLSELRDMQRRGVKFGVIDGWEYHTSSKVCPFREIVGRLFEEKTKARKERDEFRERLAKLVLNSIYGKFAQTKGGCGRLFNPVYAAEITARVRIRILQDAARYYSEVYEIKTDSVVGKLRPEWSSLWDETGFPEALGAFVPKKNQAPIRVQIQAGITLDGARQLIHNRGFSIKNKKIVVGDDEDHIVIPMTRPLHLGEALAQGRMDEVNVFEEVKKQMNVDEGAFRKRIYPVDLKVGDLEKGRFPGEPIDDAYLNEVDPPPSSQSLLWYVASHPSLTPDGFLRLVAALVQVLGEESSRPSSSESPAQSRGVSNPIRTEPRVRPYAAIIPIGRRRAGRSIPANDEETR